MKKCQRCNQEKDEAEFYRAGPSRKMRLNSYCKECEREWHRQLKQEHRFKVLCKIAKGHPVCGCCGEARKEFLAIDHVDGGGNEHRRAAKGHFTDHLLKPDYADDVRLRVLCHNCNMSIGFYGYCPHKEPDRFVENAFRKGGVAASSRRKVTDDQVREIRKMKSQGHPGRVIAETLNLRPRTVASVMQGKTWKDVV